MKFSQLIVASSFAIFATATHTITANPPASTVTTVSQCNSGAGTAYCCNSSQLANAPAVATTLALLGIVISPIDALLGLGCTTILLGGTCDNQVVCCTDNEFNGLVNVGCNNISL